MSLMIGQKAVRAHILGDVLAAAHDKCRICSKHLLLRLDEGCGRTTLLRYIATMFRAEHVRDFRNINLFIEKTLPATYKEFISLYSDIFSEATFYNHFTGLIGLDVSNLESIADREYISAFVEMIKDLSEHAMMIFFLPSEFSARRERIERMLFELCEGNIASFSDCRYTAEELMEIFTSILKEKGITPDDCRFPINAKEYIFEHADELTPHRLKCLAKEMIYNSHYLGTDEPVILR